MSVILVNVICFFIVVILTIGLIEIYFNRDNVDWYDKGFMRVFIVAVVICIIVAFGVLVMLL